MAGSISSISFRLIRMFRGTCEELARSGLPYNSLVEPGLIIGGREHYHP